MVDEDAYLWFYGCWGLALCGADDLDDVVLEAEGDERLEEGVREVGLEGEEGGTGDAVFVGAPSLGELGPLGGGLWGFGWWAL